VDPPVVHLLPHHPAFAVDAGKKRFFFKKSSVPASSVASELAAETGASVTVTEVRTECTTEVELEKLDLDNLRVPHTRKFVYYESMKRKLKIKPIL
jgi:hypothetical protein